MNLTRTGANAERRCGDVKETCMQFGVFSVSDITRDPVSGATPSEAERIDAIVRIAQKTEEVGLDVFAIGEHHNPPLSRRRRRPCCRSSRPRPAS
jgi:Luciferase-like monooxygenase